MVRSKTLTVSDLIARLQHWSADLPVGLADGRVITGISVDYNDLVGRVMLIAEVNNENAE